MKKMSLAAVAMLLGLALFPAAAAAQTFVYVNDDALYDAMLPHSNTVSAFSVGPGGVLAPVPGSPFSTGTGHFGCFGGFYASNRLAIAKHFLFASNCFSHSISSFSIDSSTGALTLVGTPLTLTPTPVQFHPDISMAATPDGQYLIAATDTDALNETRLHVLSIGGGGELTAVPGSPVSVACPSIAGITISPNGKFLAVPCGANSQIHMYGIGAAGDLTPVTGSPFTTPFAASADINSASNLLFAGTSSGVAVFALGADGSLTQIPGSPFPTGTGTATGSLVLSPDEHVLYVSNPWVRSVTAFAVAPDGTLTLIAGSPFPADPSDPESFSGPAGLATDPTGSYLFAAAGVAIYPSGVYAYPILAGGALGASAFYPSNPDEGVPLSVVVHSANNNDTGDTVGPVTSAVLTNPNPVAVNTPGLLTAVVDDTTTGGSAIASAAYSIDGGSFVPMHAADGGFNAVAEEVAAYVGAFDTTGVRSICVRGTDQPGNVGAPVCVYVAVYDPNGSFVTGGGAVESTAGADLVNTSAAGPATFGFVSKYTQGKSTPVGNLEFQFKAGNINFKSTSIDWLVVTGEPRAIFQGTGTLNGATVCKFTVDAWDISHLPGGVDAFGLKIFACAGGGDRYDLPPTPIIRGSIIIHKK